MARLVAVCALRCAPCGRSRIGSDGEVHRSGASIRKRGRRRPLCPYFSPSVHLLGCRSYRSFPPPPQYHRLDLLRSRAGSGLGTLAGGYAEFWLASGWGSQSLGATTAWFASWAWVVQTLAVTFLLLLFPDGRLPSPRWRPVAWLAGLGIGGLALGFALEAGPLGDFPQVVNPYGIDSPIVGVVQVASGFALVGSMVASAISVIVRARRAGRVERQQIKWLAYGGAVVVGTTLLSILIAIWSVTVSIAVINLALLTLPVLTGIAIVRYRLYDIDLLINRTLVYGALTVLLSGYVGLSAVVTATPGSLPQPHRPGAAPQLP